MDDLGGALRTLARHVEVPSSPEPAELWTRGRSRVRRRRAAAVAAVVLVIVMGAAVATAGPEPRLISPASAPHSPGIPERVDAPPGWLPTGNVGPLSVIGVGLRHGTERLFGIGAASGRYRFLDAGDRVPGTPVALSPDGRRVAYWAGSKGVVRSLTTIDTVHGTKSRLDAGAWTPLGLHAGPLAWLDDGTVLLQFGQRRKQGSSTVVPDESKQTETFRPDGHEATTLLLDPHSAVWSHSREGLLLVPMSSPDPGATRPVDYVGFDRSLNATGTEFELPPGSYASVSRSGDTVVAVGHPGDQGDQSLLAGTVPPLGGVTTLHDVGALRIGSLLGWHSDRAVLVTGWRHSATGNASLFDVDIVTGKVRRVGSAGGDVSVLAAVASDLLEQPFVAASPPRGLDPGLVRSAAGGALALIVAGLLWWRRRGRA